VLERFLYTKKTPWKLNDLQLKGSEKNKLYFFLRARKKINCTSFSLIRMQGIIP